MSHFVLVVDDDAIVTELLEDWLQEEGCLVATAHTGVEALDLLEGLTPDLILCDYIMPELDGIEFLRRSQASCPDACRILITGNGNLRVAVEAINEANVYKFIEKPLKRDGLMITVRRALEHSELNQRIIQSDKLASLGQLAAGVAHEIKSPAAFLSSNIQILRDYVEVLEKIADVKSELSRVAGTGVSAPHLADRLETFWREEGLDEVLGDLSGLIDDAAHGVDQISHVAHDLLDFARADKDLPGDTDVTACIRQTLRLVDGHLKHRCRVELDLGDVPRVVCNSIRLQQVLTNLLVNAAQAAHEGSPKRNTVRVAAAPGPDPGTVSITVSDTGCGMSEGQIERIFDPFYTTKPTGTGLGLAVSSQIIRHYRGKLTVQSALGEGTTFTIQLPDVTGDQRAPREAVHAPAPIPRVRAIA